MNTFSPCNPLALLLTALATMFVLLSGCAPEREGAPFARAGAPLPDSAPTVPDWSAKAGEAIAAGEYAPQAAGAGFRATNRAQNLRATFSARGIAVTSRDGSGEVTLALSAWGREGTMAPAVPADPAEGTCIAGGGVDAFGDCLRRIEFARPGLVEWWENQPDGLEQGFTVTGPPDGDGALVFELAVTGAITEVENDEALLVRRDSEPLRFAELAAWDERGRSLPAWMEETEAGLRLVVDDSGAIGVVTVDPLLTTAGWTAESDQVDAYFGWSVASAGDVNADGFGDVIVGALLYDDGETAEGAAFLYLGSKTGLTTSAAWTAQGDQAQARLGMSVASAGDVNGDGYGDVVAGAIYYTDGQSREGGAFVYLGSASGLSTSPSWTAESNQASSYFGWSVAAAGDVNGDGYGDLLVTAPYYDNGASDEGRAFLYLGSASGLASSAAWTAEANQATALFGTQAASAGDVNGDGYSDVVVGAYQYDGGSTDEGRAYVYLGSASGLAAAAAWTAESNQTNAFFGYSVGSAGDVNGDGYSDLVVGAYYYDDETADEGRAYVYLGSASGLASSAAWTGESDQATSHYGFAVASAGDINGDGYSDVAVGARYYDTTATSAAGQVFVYLGSASGPSTTASSTLDSGQNMAWFGYSAGSAGDVNGDGFGDLIVGSAYYDNGSSDEGKAFVYLGSASGLATDSSWTAESDQASALFGASVASAGDVNGDGYGDVVVGAPYYDDGETNEGTAFVYLGAASGLATIAAWTAASDQTGAYFGSAVASAGDVNGDGYGDVAVGAELYDNGSADEGRVYVYLGSSTGLTTTAAWTEESDQAGAEFGHSVSAAGDVNGDGYGDIIVGAYLYDNGSTDEGMAFLFLGSASGLATAAAWTAEADQKSAAFGCAVASAGDVDGDGFADIAVGAYKYDTGLANQGGAFVYLGSASGLGTGPSWTGESDQAGAGFGYSVSSAGDVNGDGYGDLVVGAYGYDYAAGDEGQAYLYLGSASGLNATESWTAASSLVGAYFGTSVSSAGDVNGDGYGDVVVGAPYFANGSAQEGRTFVYLGTAAGLSSGESWTAESNQESAYFGVSVGSAGDVNGDGYGDLIVGAYTYDDGQANEGRAYLYMGNGADGATPLSLAPQARQPGSTTPIAPGLSSTSETAFDVAVIKARGIGGAGNVKLQVEAKPLGTPFDSTGLATSASYTNSGLGGVELQEELSGLTGATGYHWRARVLSSPAEGRPQGWGPWLYGGLSGNAAGSHVFTAGTTFYADADSDGYGTSASSITVHASAVSGYVADATDCDDGDDTVNPGAIETVADGIDQDCDLVDSCYTDADDDDHGTSVVVAGSSLSCASGTGAVTDDDCDDADAMVFLGSAEAVADGIDQDCDGVDACYTDVDGDNYGTSVVVAGSSLSCVSGSGAAVPTDCDDTSATVYVGAAETVADGIDQDCDSVDACYTDADGDNYGTAVVTDGSSLSCISGSGAAVSTDCDDSSATVYLGATEVVADGNDQDCDGVDACYTDADGDNHGTTVVTDGSSLSCDAGSGAASEDDCDDTNSMVSPAGTEVVADGVDQDCDAVDSCYTDADGDDFGTTVVTDGSSLSCAAGTGATVPTDCDDAVTTVYPGATETVADGIDQDCDSVDSCYTDADGDDYGTTVVTDGSSLSCVTGSGAAVATDCDDGNASVSPAASETVADGADQDCDAVDACYADADGDDYGTTVVIPGSSLSCVAGDGAAVAGDCDDADAAINPAATELAGDEVDQDCDEAESCYVDADYDAARSAFVVASPDILCSAPGEAASSSDLDCDDGDASAFPDAAEITGSGVDEDCDGAELCYLDADDDEFRSDSTSTVASTDADCDDTGEAPSSALTGDCDDRDAAFHPGASEADCADPSDYNCDGASGYANLDGDAFSACEECDDDDASVFPGALEVAGDGVDGDCDGVDLCYLDSDDDGYRPDATSTTPGTTLACDGVGEASELGPVGDCDDADGTVNPDAVESVGDLVDANCDGAERCYVDADGDGYRSEDGAITLSASGTACDGAGEALASAGLDCDDADATINPAGTEAAGDGLDGDCDDTELCYADADDDGYRPDGAETVPSPDVSCAESGEATAADPTGDCDDGDASVSPDGTELVGDAVDSDCDGTELCYADADDDGYRSDSYTTVASSDSDCDDATEALASTLAGDCDDADAAFSPGAAEADCADPADYNCDGSVGYADADGDGFAACEECDDVSAAVNPGETELAGDLVDQDCDGVELCFVDGDDDGYRVDATSETSSANVACDGAGEAVATDGLGDCADDDAAVSPGAVEVAGDEVDQDCDGAELCYVDADDDGYTSEGGATVTSGDVLCDGPGEATASDASGDCDDATAALHPGAAEGDCSDPIDYNCDGSSGYADADGDGFAACEECADGDGRINPDADEVCNELDDDCDGTIDQGAVDAGTWYADADRDGYTNPDAAVAECAPPEGYAAATVADCDDANNTIHPYAAELLDDGIDQDCDGEDLRALDSGVGLDDGVAADPEAGSCGCGSSAGVGGLWVVAALALVGRRRRAAGGCTPGAADGSEEPR